MQTAKKPAPKPARRWVKTLSENPGNFKMVYKERNRMDKLECRLRTDYEKQSHILNQVTKSRLPLSHDHS